MRITRPVTAIRSCVRRRSDPRSSAWAAACSGPAALMDVGRTNVTTRQAPDFEGFVAHLSRTLSSAATEELDEAIVEGLRDLALHLGVQRAFLGRMRDGLVYSDHFWLHPDLRSEQTELYRVFDPTDFPIVGRSLAGETVAIRSLDEIPESSAERRYMEQTGGFLDVDYEDGQGDTLFAYNIQHRGAILAFNVTF